MNVAIVFDSATGTTEAAAEAMGSLIRAAGHECTVSSVRHADPATVSAADAICVGSWCKGLFFIRQHATEATMDFIDRLDGLDGKPAAVFCTTAISCSRNVVDPDTRMPAPFPVVEPPRIMNPRNVTSLPPMT